MKKTTTKKISETKCGFFEKINKMDKPLDRLTNKKRRRLTSMKSEMKKEVTTATT